MSRNQACSHIHQGRSDEDGQNHVGCGCGKTHSQNQRCDHCKQQADQQPSVGNRLNEGADLQSESGKVDYTHDDSGKDTGRCNRSDALSRTQKSLEELFGCHVLTILDETDNNRRQNREEGGALCAESPDKHEDQNCKRHKIEPTFLHDFTGFPYVGGIRVRDIRLVGNAQDRDRKRNVVKHSRNEGSQSDCTVGNSRHLTHKECDCTHDRRHDLTSGRRDGLDGTCELALESHPLHQGNRKGSRSYDVGSTGTVDGTHEHRREDRCLCRASL